MVSILKFQAMWLLVCLIFLICYSAEENGQDQPDWVLAFPPQFAKRQLPSLRYNDALKNAYGQFIATNSKNDNFRCHELILAMKHAFYAQENGLVVEMGAAGGDFKTHANSYNLEVLFNWNRILIEANPVHFENLRKQPTRPTPTAFAVGAAVCETEEMVHYVYNNDTLFQYISGIYEMMNGNFRRKFHKDLYAKVQKKGPLSKWKVLPDDVIRIRCVPMSTILEKAGVTHINWFSLDTEGGELAVLHTIDWSTTTIDILTVETEPWYRPDGYLEKVQAFMEDKGYVMIARQHRRNSWFRHKSFNVSSMPGANHRRSNPFSAV